MTGSPTQLASIGCSPPSSPHFGLPRERDQTLETVGSSRTLPVWILPRPGTPGGVSTPTSSAITVPRTMRTRIRVEA